MDIKLNRRQFLITNNQDACPETFIKQTIRDNIYLFHDADLRVSTIKGKHDEYTVLGHYTDAHADGSIQIPKDADERIKLTYGFSGKWVLLTKDNIITDPVGLIPLFYAKEDAYFYISSSIAILQTLLPPEALITDPREVSWGTNSGYISWFVAPFSKFKGIKRLIASQELSFESLEIKFIKRIFFDQFQEMDYDKKLNYIKEYCIKTFQQVDKTFNKKWLALTCGNDSRLSLASALAANMRYPMYTFHHKFISRQDIKVPKQIAKMFSVKHHTIVEQGENPSDEDLFLKHTAGSIMDADRYFFFHNQYQQIPLGTEDIIIRTGISPILKNPYFDRFSDVAKWEDITPTEILKRFKTQNNTEWTVDALSEWIEWYKKYDSRLKWTDRFFLDQREGAWMGGTEYSIEILPYISFQPFNNQGIIDLLLSIDETKRGVIDKKRGGYIVFHDLYNVLAPELNTIPVNPMDYWREAKRYYKWGMKKLKKALS